MSNDNGATWVKIFGSVDNSSAWYKVSVDLSAYGGQTVKLKFAFDSVDRAFNDYRGWYIDDIAVFSDPASVIADPASGTAISGQSYTISGTASDNSGSGLKTVEVSTNDGPWQAATGTASWSYSWTLPADGSYVIKSRATDNIGNVETPGNGVNITVDKTPPVTTITNPVDGAAIKGTTIRLSGTANDGTGSGVAKEEISTDGGKDWSTATGTASWYYDWTLPLPANYSAWRVASAWIRDVQSNDTISVRVKHMLSADGSKVRVGFVSGPTQALTLNEAYIGNDAGGGAVSGNMPLTFGGSVSVTVPAGATIFSDPVSWNAARGGTVVVSTYGTGLSYGKSYDYPGYYEYGDAAGLSRPLANQSYWYGGYDTWNALVVEVLSDGTAANENVLLVGDSITLGGNSGAGGGGSWAKLLGARVNVFNGAYSGTSAANETGAIAGILGHGIKYDKAIVSLGTNDIGYGYSESAIESNLSFIFTALQSAGIAVIAGTILPRSAYGPTETIRLDVNNWLKTLPSGIKGVIDFDALVRDPASPNSMLPDYDSGDHVHPNELGHAAMFDAIEKGDFFKGGMVFDISARATDIAGNVENPGPKASVTVDNSAPTSVIENITSGTALTGTTYTVRGRSSDGAGSGVANVEVSTDGGATWNLASGASSWDYGWLLPPSGGFVVKSRATDRAGNVESPGAGVNVTITPYGSPELQHDNWDPSISGGTCNFCHITGNTFLQPSFKNGPGFCYSCHNPSGVAHEKCLYGARGHSIMTDVTSANGSRTPTYGNITAGEYNNQPFSRLAAGNKITCVTCHNAMRKTEDYGRSWEYTTTSDYLTYAMQRGGWDMYGYLVPKVYRDTSLWTGPAYVKDKKAYLVNPSEYAYNETAGTITFKTAQPVGVYIYVSLDYPYLRASSQGNRLCSDCHTQAMHKGNNCLTCHQAHNTDNLKGIRGLLRTTNRTSVTVKFLRYTGANSFADGNTTYDGVCEVCHTQTKYYRRDGTGFVNHSGGVNYDGKDCTACHSHQAGFAR